MIKKFIRRMFNMGAEPEPRIYGRDKHGIARSSISHGALKVCEILRAHDYSAYIVGGAVRDLLLGVAPKDFDVATDAHPDEVHRLFRRSHLIGRRFKLVHVLFGQETVEVSTFRAGEGGEADEHGRLLRDNVYGTLVQDAARRDFTANALYYDPHDETVLDYHGGFADVRKKTMRIIGDARLRFREDPVRMLRAVRFAAKLGFAIDPKTRAPIHELADLIENVPAARLFEEMLKLLLSGHSAACLAKLRKEGLHHGLLPLLDVIVEQPLGERFLRLALDQTDTRIRTGKSVSPAFLFAALLWHEVLAAWKTNEGKDMRSIPALYLAMDQVLDAQTDKLSIPRRLTTTMKEIWALQPRLEQRSGKRALVLLTHPRFRAGYDFMLLRAESGEVPMELANWWTRFQDAELEERSAMLIPDTAPKKRPRRRRGSKVGGAAEPAPALNEPRD
ncbi:MAG: polynucleotide adenylyltransferase PcnB [Betaproteobacteria bacterium]|nr:polynucleotide adenylyltransferase PcnB [Betaproteobacteria bacterium]